MKTIYLDKVNSTNTYAKENFAKLEDRTVIVAKKQFSGHGRYSRKWVDLGENNLFMTIVLKPSVKFDYANLTQYLSVVLCELLKTYKINPEIKWPNDILICGKKISGILCESVLKENNLIGLVLGVGVNLNVNQDNLNLVEDKAVTALNLETSKFIDVDDFQMNLCQLFFEKFDNFVVNGFACIKNDYLNYVKNIGENITVNGFNSKVSGILKNVNDKGEIELEVNNSIIILNYGDIM